MLCQTPVRYLSKRCQRCQSQTARHKLARWERGRLARKRKQTKSGRDARAPSVRRRLMASCLKRVARRQATPWLATFLPDGTLGKPDQQNGAIISGTFNAGQPENNSAVVARGDRGLKYVVADPSGIPLFSVRDLNLQAGWRKTCVVRTRSVESAALVFTRNEIPRTLAGRSVNEFSSGGAP